MTTATARPQADEYNQYYASYINRVPDGDLVRFLDQQIGDFRAVLDGIGPSMASDVHAPYTWTIKQVVGHLIDCEKIFGTRIHRFASRDEQPLPGIDQGPYVDNNDYDSPSLRELTDELEHCRRANLCFLRRLQADAWDQQGEADGNPITVRALAFILGGHVEHHLEIIKQRVAT